MDQTDHMDHITTPMGMPMAGMAQGIMTLTAIMSIAGAPAGGHTIATMWIEFTEDRRRLLMSLPLLP